MKRVVLSLIILATLVMFACKSGAGKKDSTIEVTPSGDLRTLVYKIDNISQASVSDTIWKMIFTMNEGIDQISISQDDSTIVFKINEKVYSEKDIVNEMKKRGAVNIQKVN